KPVRQPIGETSRTSSEWLRMCSAIMCSSEWTVSDSRCSVLGWVKRTSSFVSTSTPGSSLRSAMRRQGAAAVRWSTLKLSTFMRGWKVIGDTHSVSWCGTAGAGSAAGAGGAPADDADELLAQRVIRRARPGEGDAGGRRLAQRSGDGVLAVVEPGQRQRHPGEADTGGRGG